VTAIIVSYNTRGLLKRCLESLLPEIAPGDVDVVVVDNGSRDGSAELLRHDFPWVRLVESSVNLGFGGANNTVLRQLDTPYALLLNSDTEVLPGAIRALLGCMERHPRAGAVGCRLLNPDGSLQRSCWRFPTPAGQLAEAVGISRLLRRQADYADWDFATERPVDFAIGACLLLRAAALCQVDLFDERFFLYAEETDLCRRLSYHGWQTWYTPDGSVIHRGGASGSVHTGIQFLNAQSLYFQKWYGQRGLAVLRLSHLVRAVVRIAIYGAATLIRPGSRYGKRLPGQAALLRWALRPDAGRMPAPLGSCAVVTSSVPAGRAAIGVPATTRLRPEVAHLIKSGYPAVGGEP